MRARTAGALAALAVIALALTVAATTAAATSAAATTVAATTAAATTAAATTATATATARPGPGAARPGAAVRVSVWLPSWSMAAALQSTVTGAAAIERASPVWYTIAGDATIEDAAGAGDPSAIAELRQHGIAVVPTVTESDGLAAFDRTLASPARRRAMVAALVTIARTPGYSGLDLDFEQFAVDPEDDLPLADAAAAGYPTLVSEACDALRAIGRSCLVTVMARTSAAHVLWRRKLATWVYDYAALASAADRIQVMAYDEHAPNTGPGPVSGWTWLQQVIAYTRASVPLGRVELAVPAYGYDWSAAGTASIAANQAPALAADHGVTPSWNPTQCEDTFTYRAAGRTHTVWYESTAADVDRARLALADGFAGVDLWAAGDEAPGLWAALGAISDPLVR